MSLRLRLALAFLLLSALPLGAFAAYSYASSKAALRAAAHAEAESTARELEQRVAAATADIDRRLRVLSTLPIETWLGPAEAGERAIAPQLAELDQALPYLENLRFVAEVPAPPASPEPPEPGSVAIPVPPEPPAAPEPSVAAMPAPVAAPAPAVAPVEPAPPAPATPAVPTMAGFDASEPQTTVLISQIAKIQSAALAATASATRTKGRKLDELGLESMAAQFEARAQELERQVEERQHAIEAGARVEGERMRKEMERAAKGVTRERKAVKPLHAPQSSLWCDVSNGNQVVGQLQAKIKGEQLFHSVLSRVDRRKGEIPFALGAEQALIASSDQDSARLESIPAIAALRGKQPGDRPGAAAEGEWIVVSREEPTTGYRLGIARPLSAAMAELKRAVARNFAVGMALVGMATVGFFPLTSRFVRSVRELDRGAARIAAGDLATRVEVPGRDELGRLGLSFNRMAEQLAEHQAQLLAEERRRKEEEIVNRLLAAENERRGRELEEARQFQLSLLPRELPKVPGLELAVEMTTATEVGGDYYDFQLVPGGDLILAIGDATGHGAAAGTLVTAVKSLFAAMTRGPMAESPAEFLVAANAAIHRMGMVRRAMALAIARTRGDKLLLSSAGMPPVLHFRGATGAVDELVLPGTPLGSRAEFPYSEVEISLGPGDALLFVSDGLPELPNAEGEPFGYERLRSEFGRLASSAACDVVAGLRAAALDWGGDRPPVDDMTLLAVRRV